MGGHDIDRSDARNGHRRAAGDRGIKTYEHALDSNVDTIVFGRDIDGSDAREKPVRPVGKRIFEHGHLASDVDTVVLGHDIDGSDAQKQPVRTIQRYVDSGTNTRRM